MQLVGWVLIVLGTFFELLAAAGAAKEIAKNSGIAPQGAGNPFDWLIALIKAMAAAPVWIACFAAGLVLIYVGSYLTGNPINLPIPGASPSPAPGG